MPPDPTVALVWFRRDLRLADNPALRAALGAHRSVIPVYLHAPDEEDGWAPGAASRWWLHHSLAALDAELRDLGSRLVLRRGSCRAALARLLEETGAGAVYWNRLYEPAVTARDRALKTWLRERGLRAESRQAALLAEPWELRTGAGEPYRVFTPFWKKFRTAVEVATPLSRPRKLKPPRRWPASEPLAALKLLSRPDWAAGLRAAWTPGERGGLARLRAFSRGGLAGYAAGRDYPARDKVSRLSPHLHFGEVSPRQVWHAVRGALRGAGLERDGEAYLRELGWREFAHHVLFHFPHTPEQPLYEKYRHFPWRPRAGALLRAWRRGATGYPIVDAGMRELWHSGWMHNRVRMIVASLLVKNIRAHWLEGARWFWDTLVDADLANNSMGWQWSAGCGADAAPYFRIFNPVTQGRRFDPEGAYIRRWLPELSRVPDKYLHAPWQMPEAVQDACGLRIGRDYPAPIVDYRTSREEALAALKRLKEKP